MSVRFAPARTATHSPIAKVLTRGVTGPVANDLADTAESVFMTDTTQAALRHFAEHGLRAVPVALDNASRAATAACAEDYAHWLGICRELDAKAAKRFEAGQRPQESALIG